MNEWKSSSWDFIIINKINDNFHSSLCLFNHWKFVDISTARKRWRLRNLHDIQCWLSRLKSKHVKEANRRCSTSLSIFETSFWIRASKKKWATNIEHDFFFEQETSNQTTTSVRKHVRWWVESKSIKISKKSQSRLKIFISFKLSRCVNRRAKSTRHHHLEAKCWDIECKKLD